MKWKIFGIILAIFLVIGVLGLEDGYNNGFVICRDPFCFSSSVPSCSNSNFLVLITNPINGSNLFWGIPSITENLTVTTVGSESGSLTCSYRIDNNAWNDFDVCGFGSNSSWVNHVTLPVGYPVTITVNITDNCMSVYNQTSFSVYARGDSFRGRMNYYVFFLIGFMFIYLFFVVCRRKKRFYT